MYDDIVCEHPVSPNPTATYESSPCLVETGSQIKLHNEMAEFDCCDSTFDYSLCLQLGRTGEETDSTRSTQFN